METAISGYASIELNKDELIRLLDEADARRSIASLRKKIAALKESVCSDNDSRAQMSNAGFNGNSVSLRRDVLASELDQIIEARTIERARYYIKRLRRAVEKIKTTEINDINLLRWKEYEEIITDSLWVLPRRDTAGAHLSWYWGNFIPQIPRQLMLRYTKKNGWVLDTFAGSGTTLIEARRLGRNCIGVELSRRVARKAVELIERESNPHSVTTEVITGDARTIDLRREFDRVGARRAQLLIMHPPYHDIIGFSKNPKDLSAAASAEEFLKMLGEAVDNATPLLERGRYFALVIGDKYSKGEWVPLGFECMNEVLKRGYSLKSIVVKNFDETRAKRDQKQLWRYRALAGGFYIFKHEYIFLFRKK
ncbi:MAG TPA: DNA methyltransferase [Blastocatellia bacterium]|nr:DNA methyltransferase [Blastocatellia bacterium]